VTKLSLTKTSPSVSLTKQTGTLRVNLNWDAHPPQAKKGGFRKLFAQDKDVDLDLGCRVPLGLVVQQVGQHVRDVHRDAEERTRDQRPRRGQRPAVEADAAPAGSVAVQGRHA
jgi:uncharacterized protein involved in tellurium resistance